ncbi:TlpA disulfide reductase family protein [Cytophagales bacterium LB-30]|uniref:TlpA disulfide reductase family protein n=1 Tax=Shiella aurantiaca TaxID=3058365 RepID=A0ABT8F0H0_9BACT|nr:TlpA disulfide reductase family protein [Shiella aurantiaca]MDN4163930.1 TlpA disulfide reductase family protein [Shiella aurantiaca]
MKLQTYFIVIIFIVLGCSSPEKSSITRLTGNITNPKDSLAKLSLKDTAYVVSLDSAGKFSINLPLEKATYATFHHGQELSTLYLQPNDDLSLSLDTEQFDETLRYEGKGAENNNFMADLVLFNEKMANPYQRMLLSPKEFTAFADSSATATQQFIDGYKGKIDPMLYGIESAKIKYSTISLKINYPSTHKYYAKTDSLTLPEGYYNFLSEFAFDQSQLLDHYQYTNAILDYAHYLWGKKEDNRETVFARLLNGTDSLISTKEVKGSSLATLFEMYVPYVDIAKADSLFAQYKAALPITKTEKISKTLAKLRKLAPGNEVPDFQFYTSTGDSLKLSDFAGKLVYIDLWATWCGPCIAEQPHWEKLFEEMKGSPVVFLGVSIDDSRTPWEKMLENRKIGGTQVWMPGGWNAEIMNFFVVEGIPRYILLDEEGKIIKNNAPRPSGNIGELLNSSLAKKGTII